MAYQSAYLIALTSRRTAAVAIPSLRAGGRAIPHQQGHCALLSRVRTVA